VGAQSMAARKPAPEGVPAMPAKNAPATD
jgi:hypothetical protein